MHRPSHDRPERPKKPSCRGFGPDDPAAVEAAPAPCQARPVVRTGCALFVALACCDAREPAEDPARPDDAERSAEPQPPSPPPAPKTRIDPKPFAVELAEVRDGGAIVEIELSLGRPLPPTNASRPTLHVGAEVVTKSRHPDGELDRLVFLVPREQFDRMADGATLEVHGLVLSRSAVPVATTLDKSAARAP